ncbi:hypothetical protein MSBRW_1965 [Methanosarcina barkeri str. Wiesmoor]|uniref:Uncharacterized protein n=2 Tax=Methanosarcina barkeri TaxID=2208 RepID=A0A0E3QMK9_METBA|nr:UPF0228 family protein [Methanosarcina barkeri]AKB51218.1 hypothetical protein MSBRW_1965 [Methanosarcina barkeri str. Wiesmoor]
MIKQTQETKVGGLDVEFENGTTEPEVKAILENCNLNVHIPDYDVEDIVDKYYIKVEKYYIKVEKYYIKVENNENIVIRDKFKSAPDKKKKNYYIISLSEQAIENKSFLEMLDKNNLQIKKFVWYELHFGNESMNWIPERA